MVVVYQQIGTHKNTANKVERQILIGELFYYTKNTPSTLETIIKIEGVLKMKLFCCLCLVRANIFADHLLCFGIFDFSDQFFRLLLVANNFG